MMKTCQQWLERDVPLLFFPEGTRSKDGQVQAFKDGAFQLAIDTGAPVYPIVLTGTAHVLPKHGFVMRRSVNCRVRVLPPVDSRLFDGDVAKLRDHVRELIIQAKGELLATV